jgi:hypothetical protein
MASFGKYSLKPHKKESIIKEAKLRVINVFHWLVLFYIFWIFTFFKITQSFPISFLISLIIFPLCFLYAILIGLYERYFNLIGAALISSEIRDIISERTRTNEWIRKRESKFSAGNIYKTFADLILFFGLAVTLFGIVYMIDFFF